MTRVLFLSYYFPPIGGAGAQRPLRMVQHLSAFGYACTVVTGAGTTDDRWAPVDEQLEREVPAGTEIRRIPGPEPQGLTGWPGRAERWLRRPGPWTRWLVDGTVAVGREAGRDADLLYAWMQPYATAEAASTLARELSIPWVADLGDPWALDEMMVFPSRVHRRLELGRMRRLLSSASAIVMSTREAAQRLLEALPELVDIPVHVVPNGFDARDFQKPVHPREDLAFRIVHTGYLHTQLGREHRRGEFARKLFGGAAPGVDILTRSHVYLLEALEQVARNARGRTIELHLAGVTTPADVDVAKEATNVRLLGYVPHDQALELVRTADLLFLPMQNLPPGVRATIVPGKTYEYLASGRPILAAVPEGDAQDILASAGNADICRPDDVVAMARTLEWHLERARAGIPSPRPDPAVVSQFEYRHLAERLAGVLDGVLAS